MTAVPDPAHVPADGSAIGARAGKAWGPVRGDPGRAARLFADAERAAQSITDEYWKAGTLCDLAATDPDRAARLIADAERTARSFTDEDAKASALAAVRTRWRPPTPPAPSASPSRSPMSTSRRQR